MKLFIQVILPLRLEWEPYYFTEEQVAVGDRVRVGFSGKEYVAVVSAIHSEEENLPVQEGRIKAINGIAADLEKISLEEIALWRQVAAYYLCTVGEVYKAAYPSIKVTEEETRARVDAAARARKEARIAKLSGMIEKARKEDTRNRYIAEKAALEAELGNGSENSGNHNATSDEVAEQSSSIHIELSEAQQAAYSQVKALWKASKPVLLHGVTGSGKTEIYLKLAQEVLREGKNVLFMVPEIALSRQLEERIRSVFPSQLQVFHSGETTLSKHNAAAFIRTHSYITLGTRSAIFLPHRNLGLIIIDEEHDSSYKQDSPAPRYNGRETAIMMARIFGANVILGSATPSLESLYNCSVGRFGLVSLTKRYYDAADSDVEVIDTIAERRKNGMVGNFSRKLIGQVNDTLSRHEQVVILRERRAYAPIVQCENCGDIPKCSKCNVTLSLHRKADGSEKLVCHYCGRVWNWTGTCPKCGGAQKPLGSGTQKIEEEASALFPQARIARLDSDTAQNRKYETEVIRKFASGEIDMLIGTQIVSKGFDFSGLSLVAVLHADSILGQDDYKADERGLQLLEQFRGRCGRRGTKGTFVIQTSQPEHPVYQTIDGELDTESMMKRFLAERKLFGYPPYSRIVGVILKDYNLSRLELMSRDLAAVLSYSGITSQVQITGPYAPAVDKVSGQSIRKIRLLLPKDKALGANKAAIASAVAAFEKERKYPGHISLDVDPV